MSTFSFLSWVQSPLVSRAAAGISSLRPLVRVRLNLRVDGGGAATDFVEKDVAVHGPGDVIGLQPEAVLKTTPPAGEQQFSSLQFPSIEFLEEDLPWRYSPNDETAPIDRKAPWCFLLTLKEGEFTPLTPGSGPLPTIKVASMSLFPDAAQSWLWAHVQAGQAIGTAALPSNDDAQIFLDGDLKKNPDLALSRLLSPRKLDPNSSYRAFLVPAYETGRLAGLGIPFDPVPTASLTALTSSWAGTGSKDFPVYYQWEFHTGDAGDFESLARLLQPQKFTNFGSQPLGTITPLGSLGTSPPAEQLPPMLMPGIVLPAGTNAPMSVPAPVVEDVLAEVNQAFVRVATTGAYRRPLVAPPAYGRAYLNTPPTALVESDTDWFTKLNLHPGYRALAAIGGNIIQDNQEEYMQQAWEQVRDVITANMNLRGMQSGLQTTTSLRQQHLPVISSEASSSQTTAKQPITSGGFQQRSSGPGSEQNLIAGAGGGGEVGLENYGLHLTGLAFTRLLDPETGLTLQETVRQSRVPMAAFAPAFRRIAKPFGRYQSGQTGQPGKPGRPLRPTQAVPLVPPATLRETTGHSLRQQDSLLAMMAQFDPAVPIGDSSGITGGQTMPTLVRAYQFDDKAVDILLEAGTPAKFLYYDQATNVYTAPAGNGETGTPGALFKTAYQSFQKVRFQVQNPVKPVLDLNRIKQLVIQGTQPGPVYLARANRALRLLPHYDAYTSAGAQTSTPGARSATPGLIGGTTIAAKPAPLLQKVQPIMAYPVFKEPMSEQLRRRHPELFLPNIGEFPANAVTLLQYNHAFIEAYMVGLNHAFGSELLWREYPTDLRGSYFRQFWDVSEKLNSTITEQSTPADLADEEEAHRDILPLTSWSGPLGGNEPRQNRPELLLAVRGDLLLRFPNTVICAVPGIVVNAEIVLDFTASDPARPIYYPVNRTTLGQDILLLGFELPLTTAMSNTESDPGYFFVFHERPGEPQFGLDDKGTATPPSTPPDKWGEYAWQDLGYLLPTTTSSVVNLPTSGMSITPNPALPAPAFLTVDSSAKLAYALFQQPFMAALHASQMILE